MQRGGKVAARKNSGWLYKSESGSVGFCKRSDPPVREGHSKTRRFRCQKELKHARAWPFILGRFAPLRDFGSQNATRCIFNSLPLMWSISLKKAGLSHPHRLAKGWSRDKVLFISVSLMFGTF